MKKPRVSVIKNNIEKQTALPSVQNDCDVGQWVDKAMAEKGHKIDPNGTVDMPEYKMDNKSRKKGSKANHTVGSMTIGGIIDTPNWEDTGYFPKVQNQNQITWDPVFREISDVTILDMDIPDIQKNLREAYEDLRRQIIAGNRNGTITSANGWAVLDNSVHPNSYRYRITDAAMKKIKTISATWKSLKRNFEFED